MAFIEELETRIRNLEAQNEMLKWALSHLASKFSPEFNSFGLFAFVTDFTAAEIDELEKLFKWAFNKGESLTKEEFIKEYNKQLPKRKDMLEGIMRGYRADGVWESLCDLVLGS